MISSALLLSSKTVFGEAILPSVGLLLTEHSRNISL